MTSRRGPDASRRAVVRWAWRMFRREWRQQVLVIAVLSAAVAASIGLTSAAYTTTPVPDNAVFGAATHVVRFSGDPQSLARDIPAAREAFRRHEVIVDRHVPRPGVFEPVDYRTQDPAGRLGGPRLALLEGRYPAAGQVAITDGLAAALRVDVGRPVALDGVPRTVVGVVENPGDLGDEFVLLPPSTVDGAVDGAGEVTVLVDGSDDEVRAFRPPSGAALDIGSRPAGQGLVAAVTTLVLSTVALLLIALIAAAGFVVVAHRRMRQLGLLAAIGATERRLRLVTLANGTAVGAVAAVVGAVVGLAGWFGVAPLVERAVGYRIDQFAVPVWVIAAGMLLAVVAGTAAAWWPARTVARVPTVRALSGRPPEPQPVRRSAALAVVFAVTGLGCLVLGGDLADETRVHWTNAALLVAGVVALTLAVLFVCPLALRVLGASVGRFPVGVRLAIGDLARYRARSGAALAAITLTLGIAVALVVSTTAAQATDDEGNLPAGQLLIRSSQVDGPFVPEADDLDGLRAGVDRLVASLDDPTVTPLDAALDPATPRDPNFDGRMAISLARHTEDGWMDVSLLYVATPDSLARSGRRLADAPGDAVHSREIGELALLGVRTKIERLESVQRLEPGYDSLPGTFVTDQALTERGWVAVPSGRWLVSTPSPLTTDQLVAVQETAAGAGLTVEVRNRQGGLGALRSGATAAGMLAALGIMAMTVGLVRAEGARDLRVLSAAGATTRTRRTLTAATAGGLAILGVVLGTAAAYAGLIAGFASDLGDLVPVPILHLAVIVLGLPLAATIGAWLLSTREPAQTARNPVE
ncbi:FtsX-like permease family protein [Kribbella sp. CA-247076]|uniref:FtsX-like permease family protein n=1 Tax=Kribbella sp. CA-247076 TaxID=3239941 RepID=UPI003D8A33EA